MIYHSYLNSCHLLEITIKDQPGKYMSGIACEK
jgi:hypothetical protein